jgi:hypothetical protein
MAFTRYIRLIIYHPNPIAMNKICFSLLLLVGLLSCHVDDTKNNYVISGEIVSQGGNEFQHVIVHLLKGDQIITSSTGPQFSFPNLEEGTAYTVLPLATGTEGRNGLSTLDMVAVRKHIEGVEPFDLYQRTAADVNKDNIINQEDLEIIKNCILSSPKLFDCPTYRFVSMEHDGNEFKYVDEYNTNKLFADHEIVFVPIKLGDVNHTIWP